MIGKWLEAAPAAPLARWVRGRAVMAAFAAFAVFGMVAPACAASGVEQLQAFVAQVKSARGEFVQQQVKQPTTGASGGSSLLGSGPSSGTFLFARPGKFVWAYQKPYEQEIVSDGLKLYVYDKDLKQVTERALGGALSASPAAILFGSNDLNANFTVTDAGDHDGMQWAKLVPKAKDSQFKSVTIGFRDGELAGMTLYDVFGNETRLTFSNMQKNPPLHGNEFRFTVPPGVDVLQG